MGPVEFEVNFVSLLRMGGLGLVGLRLGESFPFWTVHVGLTRLGMVGLGWVV